MLTRPHSRQSLKKYVKANNTINASDNMFDSLFNKALKAGVDKGIFEQPKGMSFRPYLPTFSQEAVALTGCRSFWYYQAL